MKRNKFSLSHYKLLSCDMGELIPVGLTEVLPGDTFQHNASVFLRASPLLSPVMHPVNVDLTHWYVPTRLVWDDFEKFITGGPDGQDATAHPYIDMPAVGGAPIGSLADYLGVPTGINSLRASAIPFRMYAMIWNEYYRDQDLETLLTISKGNGADTTTSVALQNQAWEKDYFTTSRPWPQKGPSITLPLGTTAPVTSSPNPIRFNSNAEGTARTLVIEGSDDRVMLDGYSGPAGRSQMNLVDGLVADLSGASAITVTALREAMALQRMEENRARYGSRFTEYLRSAFGVKSSDARLQRPERLGGGRSTLQWSEVLQTAEGSNPVGSLLGHGTAANRSNRYRRFFEEHGYIVTLMSVKPKTVYAQGLFRHWNRQYKEDYFQPELQHIGQQEVLNKEVYAAHTTPNGTFGYQDRYDEYRRQESSIAGEFRDSTLNFWHMARIFGSDPALNPTFVKAVPTERVFAVPSKDVLYAMVRHSMQARRPLAPSGTSFIK